MRLKTIKLSGFKSFVDPTTFHLPSNLIGVVGPNGCGKSNIIDAVRWVMGESSARLLRGESMADVIFNGSNVRKPVSTATVELIFDNSDGSLGGEYASYAEIAIKRQVSRDGHSQYFLNGQRCRRRDITDIFLGTGLGPRSYSIIEQGMISQIVEARPEEIRAHLEEAAGISKYKERRRETENRIRHTRENLERLNDLRSEVDKQLDHLKRQARQAERYKDLKNQQRRKEAELLALQWRQLDDDVTTRQETLAETQTRLEAKTAELRSVEAEIEAAREAQTRASENVSSVQAELYEVGGDIARIEQAIQHRKDVQGRQRRERDEAEANHAELEEHLALDRVQIEEHRNVLKRLEPELETARTLENESADALNAVEDEMTAWQETWENFSTRSGEHSRQAEVERTRIDHLEGQLSDRGARLEELSRERGAADLESLRKERSKLEAQVAELEGRLGEQEGTLESVREQLTGHIEANRERGTELDQLRQAIQRGQGRLSSLEALQQAALGEDRTELADWLEGQGIDAAVHLAQELEVDAGWEAAVETALGDFLEALVVDAPGDHLGAAADLSDGRLGLVAGGGAVEGQPPDRLAARVQGPAALVGLLDGIRTAEDLDSALATVAALETGESVITPGGEWLGQGWARVRRGEGAEGGVLAREREIKELGSELAELGSRAGKLESALAEGRQSVAELERRRDDAQTELTLQVRRVAEVKGQAQGKQSRIEHLESRAAQLEKESDQLRERIDSDQGSVREARRRLEASMEEMATLEEQRGALEEQRRELSSRRDMARKAARERREQAHKLALELESRRAALKSTEQAVERMSSQMKLLDQRRRQLLEEIEAAGEPMVADEHRLKAQLDQRLAVEKRLGEARKELEQVNQGLRELEHKRGAISDAIQAVRSEVENARIELQGRRVKSEGVAERVTQADFEMDDLIRELPAEATAESWREALERLEKRITRLEPVNLAAIQEYDELLERKTYLDAQDADLTRALETLEAAIRKIDRQTRTRFKETFDRVNGGVQELFPRLFGGGHGYMELIGDDLLSAGVQIMARPPGKRVTNIHLLSGGEKALTAVAFVFAIFRLNPAPFCLLDEVDAPLDDANVARFSDMVREMAEQVQFLIVTHNKITMELAHQLTGVTMREAGVSRMVSVDMAEAERMAGA